MTEDTVQIGGLRVARVLANFINQELLPRLGIQPEPFWGGFEALVDDFTPRNVELLAVRERMQAELDQWHREHRGKPHDASAYRAFLYTIGYLQLLLEDFMVNTRGIDREIAVTAGPQLVVPVKNARFALNAANARWVSLYDALYGTDVIPEKNGAERGTGYNPERGRLVINYAREFLDGAFPLRGVHHWNCRGFRVVDEELHFLLDEGYVTLREPRQFRGYTGAPDNPASLLLRNHDLHVEICVDRSTVVGGNDPSGVSDLILEAAVTTIQDCEDSVAAVDAEDKVEVYRNWLGLILGDLTETFVKDGRTVTRSLNPDREYTAPDGEQFTLPGRSLMMVRNVGHLMRIDAVIDSRGEPVFEGLLDALVTAAIGALDIHDVNLLKNSRSGSIYIVKPKMHGPDEVEFACDVFARVEKILGLKENVLKIGIMDEERRTTVNLKECIRRARSRVMFINTGFLDRTGDEIHTCMEAGPVLPKAELKHCPWIMTYEKNNVDAGLSCGLPGHAQIGKGMWAMPDKMAHMMVEKASQLQTGATTAWVPSPTAAVLHAIHYHQVNVTTKHRELKSRRPIVQDELLAYPLLAKPETLEPAAIQRELDNNAQGILGYVVRWIDQGIGCSKVPDIRNVGLMEDRATLRISSQHMANWLHHGICSREQVEETLQRMARVVDEQNSDDPNYRPMAPDFDRSAAFQAARSLVFEARNQPNGYTEPILHAWRLRVKQARS